MTSIHPTVPREDDLGSFAEARGIMPALQHTGNEQPPCPCKFIFINSTEKTKSDGQHNFPGPARTEAQGRGLHLGARLPGWTRSGHVGMKPGWTLRLRACLVCGLTSQLPPLIAYKRKSFEFKESNHCSCYEATV